MAEENDKPKQEEGKPQDQEQRPPTPPAEEQQANRPRPEQRPAAPARPNDRGGNQPYRPGQRPPGQPPRPYDPNAPRQFDRNQPPRPGQPNQPGQPGQPPQQRQNIDWLRSRPVSPHNRPAAPNRGLDLGKPDAWSGRQKPPTGPQGPGQRPPNDQRPGPSGPGQQGPRPGPSGQPPYPRPSGPQGQQGPRQGGYQPGPRPGGFTPRPGGTGGYGAPRPGGTGGYGAPRPGGFGSPRPGGPGGARPGGFGPSRGPARGGRPGGRGAAPDWGKETAASRRARSANKPAKDRVPETEEEAAANKARRADGDAARGKPGVASRPGVLKPVAILKAKLETTAAVPEPGKPVGLPRLLTVKELSAALGVSSIDVIKELMKNGIMAPVNQMVDFDTAAVVATDLGFDVELSEPVVEETPATPADAGEPIAKRRVLVGEEDPALMQPRAPVVTIMGHVDHGKTSLLDAIRRTNVAGGEAGGITQHIGAYQAEERGKKITFLDTPGHQAFTAMRARGAQVTDVAVIVVAADDGVQPQTLEAINHARAAGVPIVVALNKVDKDDANPERVKQQLSDAGLLPEEWGGSTVVVPVSAKKGLGTTDLLDMILLVAEMADLKANPNRRAVGTIVEAQLDKAKGPLATVLVQHGTLNVGDHVVVGHIYGKIRAMFNDKGKAMRKAEPSTPASILGLSDVPEAGDILEAMPSEREAHGLATQRLEKQQREATAVTAKVTLDDLFSQIKAGKVKDLNVVLKVDVQGSAEPVVKSLQGLSDEQVKVNIIHEAAGNISESDVTLAAASGAIVIGFNVEPDPSARRTAELQGVDVRTYKIIYDLIDAVEKSMKGLYEPKFQEVVEGHAEVRQVFKLSKGGTIAGCYVTDGVINRGSTARLMRGGKMLAEAKLSSLRRFKDDVREVGTGFECGLSLEGVNDLQEKDIIETYRKERIN